MVPLSSDALLQALCLPCSYCLFLVRRRRLVLWMVKGVCLGPMHCCCPAPNVWLLHVGPTTSHHAASTVSWRQRCTHRILWPGPPTPMPGGIPPSPALSRDNGGRSARTPIQPGFVSTKPNTTLFQPFTIRRSKSSQRERREHVRCRVEGERGGAWERVFASHIWNDVVPNRFDQISGQRSRLFLYYHHNQERLLAG